MSKRVQRYSEWMISKKRIDLAREVYKTVETFPGREAYGSSDQMRPSAVSIPSTSAEGPFRRHSSEFRQCLYVALGSSAEADTRRDIARELDYMSDVEFKEFE